MYIYTNKQNKVLSSSLEKDEALISKFKNYGIEFTETIDDSITEPLSVDNIWKYENGVATIDTESEEERLNRRLISLRYKRDGLLKETDWTQGADIPAAIKDANAAYRQKLRDLPATITSLSQKIEWPTL